MHSTNYTEVRDFLETANAFVRVPWRINVAPMLAAIRKLDAVPVWYRPLPSVVSWYIDAAIAVYLDEDFNFTLAPQIIAP